MALKVHLDVCLPFRQLFVVETNTHLQKLPGALPKRVRLENYPREH
jgi:hypothetical protein